MSPSGTGPAGALRKTSSSSLFVNASRVRSSTREVEAVEEVGAVTMRHLRVGGSGCWSVADSHFTFLPGTAQSKDAKGPSCSHPFGALTPPSLETRLARVRAV